MAIEPELDASRRTHASPWAALAGDGALISDIGRQLAIAALGHDARALDTSMVLLRETILDAIELHNTSECFNEQVTL